jgi:hypothetical protein
VTICAGRLAVAGCEKPRIERDGKKLEMPMSSSGLWWADDDDGDDDKISCSIRDRTNE